MRIQDTLFLILINLFGCTVSWLQREGSLIAACGIQFPNQGLNPGPLYGKHRALATGPPGKSAVQETLIHRLPLQASGAQSCWTRAESTAKSRSCLSPRAKSWGVLHHLLTFIAWGLLPVASLPGAFRLLSTSSQRAFRPEGLQKRAWAQGTSPPRDHVPGSMYQSSCDEFTPISHKSWWRKLINLLGVVQGKGLGLMPTPLMRTLMPLQRICCAGATLKSQPSPALPALKVSSGNAETAVGTPGKR